jgi:hypothetical protein
VGGASGGLLINLSQLLLLLGLETERKSPFKGLSFSLTILVLKVFL